MTDITHTIRTERRLPQGKSRTIEVVYLMDDLAQRDRRGDLETPALYLRVSDFAERGIYLVTVDRQVRTRFGYRQVIDYGASKPDWVKALSYYERRVRYSAKTMTALFDSVERELVTPQLDRLLEWAAGAIDEDS